MLDSSRPLRRPILRGGRIALVLPTALLAITAMVSPSFADDVTPDDGGETPAVTETPVPSAEPDPAPVVDPAPAEVAEPKAAPASESKAAPTSGATSEKSAPTPGAAFTDGVRATAKVVTAAAQETCKANDGWIKLDGLSGLTLTITAPAGKVIVGVCAKSSTNVVTIALDPGQASYTIESGTGPWAGFVNGNGRAQELSHASYLLADEPEDIDEIPAPEIPVVDACGPDNAVYGEVPTGNYTIVRNLDGSITLKADAGYEFPGGADERVFPAPTDSNEPCDEPAEIDAPEVPVVDPCGTGNAVYGDVPAGDYEVERNDDGSITLTASAGSTFAGGAETYTYPVPVETNTEACEPTEILVPEVPVDDPCDTDNASYGEVPVGEYVITPNEDGSITLEAHEGFIFPGDKTTHTFPVPVETNTEACPAEDPTRVVLCTYPADETAPIPTRTALGTIVIVALEDLVDLGFEGVFPYEFTDGDASSTAIRFADEGEVAEDIDAVVCGVEAEIEELPGDVDGEVDGEVGGLVEELPNTGGPAGWLVPLGAGLVLAGAALVLARRRETV